eukprot:GILI01020247.1.p2 GENE.GILI01020247.1~~GILI01020247.1.p2  ORF type:complete len:134 (+),score=18.18 GILI01020247.1:145-546(+)
MNEQILIEEVFDIIRTIKDPEFPQTLQELNVVSEDMIEIEHMKGFDVLKIQFVPTVPHCAFAVHIGLCIRAKLKEEFPQFKDFKLDVTVKPGTHNTQPDIDKQVNDKERVSAALENPVVMALVRECIKSTDAN